MGQHTETSPVTIGFGIQWPVDTKTDVSGGVALLEFAYQKVVYLVQTLHFIRDGYISLPHALMAFLQSPVYTKIGINIVTDLKRLHSACSALTHTAPFLGHADIGIMAKGRNAAPKGCATLPMLSSIVLHHSLPQEPNVCVSSHWGKVRLPENFIMHAAWEVFAIWSIYSTLGTMDKPQTVSSHTPGGTSVTMMAPDGREIAQGVIALNQPTTFNGVNVTKTRVLMVVREVLVPAYMISGTLMQSRQPTALSELGTVPFTIVCQAGHLQTQSCTNSLGHGDLVDFSSDLPPLSIGWDQLLESDMAFNDSQANPMDVVEGRYAWWEIVGESGDSENLVDKNLVEQDPRTSEHDPALDKAICDFLLAILKLNPDTQTLCTVEEILKKGNSSYEAKLLSKPKWVLACVRRYVPTVEILLSRVAAVIQTFDPLKDSTTEQTLFNEKAWDAAKNILEHIWGGYYSDPPSVSLCFEVGKDKHRLTLYRCCHGTNDLEGGVHQNLIRWWQASFNVSSRHAHNMALEYGVTHNMQVGTENRIGHPYKGHFDVPLKNQVLALLKLTAQYFNCDPQLGYGQWIPEHLSIYYKTWLDYTNEKTSVNLMISASKHIHSLLSASKIGSPPSIETMLPQTLAETVGPCSNPSPSSPSPWELQKTIADHQLLQSTLQFWYGDQPDPTTIRTNERTSRKRAADGNPIGPDEDVHIQKKKKARTCRHC
ncbi:hypothetical protein BDN67DRAFT_1016146 [Paxillus ammoniavirescens]|nr:hypothetical protein BDN67DRAFT_1016146 [Paxillus ammoniavirescens]